MTLQAFIQQYTGVAHTGDTEANKGQCVGLVEVYIDTLGLTHDWGNAKDLLANANSADFQMFENLANSVPTAGDIIVWGASWGNGNGHTGICVSADLQSTSFVCFEQNDPTGAAPQVKTYPTYTGVIGWLHPKILDGGMTVPNTELATLFAHYNVKSSVELIAMVDEQLKFLADARAQVQLLTEKYADYDKITATATQYLQQYDDLAMWLKEITGSPTDDIAVNKAEVVTRFGNESQLHQQLNDAQKSLDGEKQRHLGDVADLTKKTNDLDVAIQKQQQENTALLTQLHQLQDQLSQQQHTQQKISWIQHLIEQWQHLLKGTP